MARPLHIAFFNRAFYPEVSATGQLLTELAEGLAREHGCRVSVVAGVPMDRPLPWGGWSVVSRESYGPVTILRVKGTRWSKRTLTGRVVNYVSYFGLACLAGLHLDRPDVVIALTDPPIVGLAALLAARRYRAKLVISYRDLFPEVAKLLDGFHNPFIEQGLHQVNRVLIDSADCVIALGQAMRTRLIQEKGARPDRVVVIPDWADCTQIVPAPKQNPFAVQHGLADRFVVMHAGNLGLSQNLEILVDAMAQLKELPDLALVFIGEGVAQVRLQAQASRLGLTSVSFLPFQPKEELSDVFATADCFVISLKPGLSGYIMPSKIYAVLAAGRPYVAAVDETCDVAQITREHECGLLAEPGNPQALAERLRHFYHDRMLTRQMGANARRAAILYDRSIGVKRYMALCEQLFRERTVKRPHG